MTITSAYIALQNDSTAGDIEGDFVVRNGEVQYTNMIVMVARARIFTPIGTYPFDTTFGSLIPQMMTKGSGVTITSQAITTAVLNALQPMINTNLIKSASCQVDIVSDFYVQFSVTLVDQSNNSYNLPLDYTGST